MGDRTTALIIARSTPFRESLQVLMQASLLVGPVRVAEDGRTARVMLWEIEPALILLDWDLKDGAERMMIDPLRAWWPRARYVVFVGTDGDRKQAIEAGADAVLVKGVRAATILETIEGLLSKEL